MRTDKPDKSDGADERNRNGRQKADRQHGLQPQPAHIDAHAGRLVIAQPECRQRPGVAHEHRHGDDEDGRGHIDLFPGCLRQAAHGPENDGGKRLFGGQIFQQRQRRIKGEDQRDAEEHDGFDRHTTQRRGKMDEKRRNHGHDEGIDRHHIMHGTRKDRHTTDERQRRAKTCSGGNAEREGAGERVGQDGLHLRAGNRQRCTNGDRHQRNRHADIPDHHSQLVSSSGRIGNGRQNFGNCIARRAERHIRGHAETQGDEKPDKNNDPARGKGAILIAPTDANGAFIQRTHWFKPFSSEAK